jgi:hypothetical protein
MGLQHFVHEIKAVITCCAAGLPFDAWSKKTSVNFKGNGFVMLENQEHTRKSIGTFRAASGSGSSAGKLPANSHERNPVSESGLRTLPLRQNFASMASTVQKI